MSPEQARAERDIDARADIWSLGVVLFEMLTGERPFTGEAQEVIDRIASAEIPLASRRVRSIDPGLDRLISACLTRDREQRLWPIAEVERGLDPFTDDFQRGATSAFTATWGQHPAGPAPPSSRQYPVAALPSEAPESEAETQRLEVAMLCAAPRALFEPPPRAIILPDVPLARSDDATIKKPCSSMSATAPLVAAATSEAGPPAAPTASWTGPTPFLGDVPPPKRRSPFVARAIGVSGLAAVVLVLAFTPRGRRPAEPAPPRPLPVVEASPAAESAPSPPAADVKSVLLPAVLAEPVVAEVPPPPLAKQESGARPPASPPRSRPSSADDSSRPAASKRRRVDRFTPPAPRSRDGIAAPDGIFFLTISRTV